MKTIPALLACGCLLMSGTARADFLTSGLATINYDQAAWNGLAAGFGTPPVLTLSGFFDGATANTLTQGQLLTTAAPGSSYTNQQYVMNGAAFTNFADRTAQPTTFAFTPGDLTNHTGSIGLGGVSRFAVFGGLGGNLLYGDFTLQYDLARISAGGTGWYLKGNIPPVAPVYDLLNVSIVEGPGTLTISGDLAVTFEIANFLYSTPADTLKDVGDFTFTATTVPEPSTIALIGLGVLGIVLRRVRGCDQRKHSP